MDFLYLWAWHVGVSLVESSSSLHQSVDHRSRVNRVHKRGTAREGHPIGPALGPLGIDTGRIGGGVTSRGGAGNRGGDGVIFAESPMAPGIPVVYRTPEQRISNPDRLNLDRRHLTMCPILEVRMVTTSDSGHSDIGTQYNKPLNKGHSSRSQ